MDTKLLKPVIALTWGQNTPHVVVINTVANKIAKVSRSNCFEIIRILLPSSGEFFIIEAVKKTDNQISKTAATNKLHANRGPTSK
jgi:hypothetical protein